MAPATVAASMDPTTVVIILAMHLISSGGLLFLIGRRMQPRSGIGQWSVGAVLFGSAYLLRLAGGVLGMQWWLLLLDGAMVAAALLFVAGLRGFVGLPGDRWRTAGLVLATAMVIEGAAMVRWGTDGRYTVLNLSLGFIYLVLAGTSARVLPHQPAALGPPLRVVVWVVGVLGALTTLRGIYIGIHGSQAAYTGLHAQVYYAYASLAAVVLAMTMLWMVFVRLNGQLAELAARDPLTRALNRNGLDEAMKRHFAARPALPLTLLLLDLDHFKQVNDAHGHSAGDALLIATARALQDGVRGSDFVARVGGEEFLVGCVTGGTDETLGLAERLRAAVAGLALPWDGQAVLACTASVGVSRPMHRLDDTERAWQEADRALYQAKSVGRNRVISP